MPRPNSAFPPKAAPVQTRRCRKQAGRHATRAAAIDRKSPSDAPCPGIGEAHQPARDRIVSPVRMGGGAFIWLKTGRGSPESAKQAEIGVASLLKIVAIGPSRGREPPIKGRKGQSEVVGRLFREIWLTRGESRGSVTMGHTVCRETDAVSCREMQDKVETSIGLSLSTLIYVKNAVVRCSDRDEIIRTATNTSGFRCHARTAANWRPYGLRFSSN